MSKSDLSDLTLDELLTPQAPRHMRPFLSVMYEANASAFGLVVTSRSGNLRSLSARLMATRTFDPALRAVRVMPAPNGANELWLVRTGASAPAELTTETPSDE